MQIIIYICLILAFSSSFYCFKNWNKLALHWKILFGLFLGAIWAIFSAQYGWATFTKNWIAPWGTIFINLLKLIAVPLVLFSIIKGVGSLSDIKTIGKLGTKTLLIYIGTTITAVMLGLLLVNILKPGTYVNQDQRIINRLSYEMWIEEHHLDPIDGQSYLNDSKYSSFIQTAKLKLIDSNSHNNQLIQEKVQKAKSTKNEGPLKFVVDMVPSNIFLSLNNNGLMLQVIFFAIFFGITLMSIPIQKANPILQFINGMNDIFLKMVDIVMHGAPWFVFTLFAGKLSEIAGNDPNKVIDLFYSLGIYMVVVLLGLLIMIFGVYPMLMMLITKRSYKSFFQGISAAQMLAFSTSSSAATLPVTIECVQDNLGVPKNITSFVLPIGATINMDGTSLYQAVAVIFLAQFHLIDLTLAQQGTIILTATLASIGAAAVPSAGLIMLIIVLESVGLNPAWIAIIFPVDRILDMCRTVVNVTGDATVATIIASTQQHNNDSVVEQGTN